MHTQTWFIMHGRKPVQLSSRIAFVRQGSNTMLLIQIHYLRSLLLPQPLMCGIKFKDVQFDDFVAREPEVSTTQPMTDEEIINLVHTENDAPQEESDDAEDETPPAKLIKSRMNFWP